MSKKTKQYHTGMRGITREPISKSLGEGEPLVIHVHQKGKEKGETNPDEGDMKHEMGESEDEKRMEGELGMTLPEFEDVEEEECEEEEAPKKKGKK